MKKQSCNYNHILVFCLVPDKKRKKIPATKPKRNRVVSEEKKNRLNKVGFEFFRFFVCREHVA